MAESISRRKYAKLVRFFTETMENPKTPQRVRLTAALRLDDIFARNEARSERKTKKDTGAITAEVEARPQETADVAPEPESTEDAAQRLIDRVASRTAVQELEDNDE